MKFYNAGTLVYGAPMSARRIVPVLAHLRQSSRLVWLMLLAFAMNIGAVVTCTAHDILDATGIAESASATVISVDDASSDPRGNPFDLSGSCEHCGCHQSFAIVPVTDLASTDQASVHAQWIGTVSPSVLSATELRPPIA